MTNTDSKTEIIDAILKNRKIIKNRIHLKQFKEHLTKEEIKKLQKPITDKLDNITEFTQQILMSEANPKNVLAIEEQDLPRLEDKNVPKNADEISPEPMLKAMM
jgi:fructose-1,6-bisphosphatase